MTLEQIKAVFRDPKSTKGDYRLSLMYALSMLERQEKRLRLAEPILSVIEEIAQKAVEDGREE